MPSYKQLFIPLLIGLFPAIIYTGCSGEADRVALLTVEDFYFDGPIGSNGAQIAKIDTNHFKITLDHAPNKPMKPICFKETWKS